MRIDRTTLIDHRERNPCRENEYPLMSLYTTEGSLINTEG
jgi:hypothetical protein